MFVLEHLWIIPLLPLLGAAANGIFGASWPRRAVNAVALGATGLATLATAELAREFALLDAARIPWTRSYFTWIVAGNFRADYALQVDSLTMVMLGVVTGVGWLIHLYSTGYMAADAGNKAFWVNRIGDFGFLLALFVLFRQFGTLDFAAVFTGAAALPVESAGAGVLTAASLVLLLGGPGKWGRIPVSCGV